MAWYKTGTISVTNGSATVTGSGTAFVANARAGYGLVGPDGRTYEVAAVVSNTQLTLAGNYQGATASGQSYAIFPTQSVIADLATQAASLISSFATVRDGVGAGLHPDGTVGAPAIRFSADQDTGFYRPAANTLALSLGGSEAFRWSSAGLGIGKTPGVRFDVNEPTAAFRQIARFTNLTASDAWLSLVGGDIEVQLRAFSSTYSTPSLQNLAALSGLVGKPVGIVANAADVILFAGTFGTERMRVESGGAVRPGADNTQTLGSSSFRWSTVYAGTGTINTSDEREKTWRGELTEAEYEAGLEVLAELGFYQWNDAIAEKGPDGARYHFGARAQQVWAIFAAHELVDPIDDDDEPGETPYSFLCFDQWDEQSEPVLGEDGEPTGETQILREAGSRFGVRYNDLTLFLLAVQARRQGEIDARLVALENAAA